MTPIEEFTSCLKWLHLLFRIIGRHIFAVEYSNGKAFYMYIALWLSYISCQAMTVLDAEHYDMSVRMICASLGCGSMQVFIKYCLLSDLHKLRSLFEFLKDVYAKNSLDSSKYYAICKRYSRISRLTMIIGFSLYTSIFAQIALIGIIESLQSSKPTPFLFIYFPFVYNPSTLVYALNTLYNTVAYLTCVVTVPPGDLIFFIVFANVPLVSSILRSQFNELSEMMVKCRPNDAEIKYRLTHYFLSYQKYNDNIRLMNECFYWYCILQFFTTVVFTVSGVSVASAENVMITHGSTATGIFQIVTYCVMGTIVENSSDRIYGDLYAFNWYRLPMNYQRCYHMLLHHAQRPELMFIAGIRPLNMETCLATLKAIYSYAMLMATII